MNARFWSRVCVFLLALTAHAGCAKAPPPAPRTDTGAEKVAKSFFEALLRDDWTAAYGTLDPGSRAWCSKDGFAKLGQAYRGLIDFAPTDVSVTVSETGDQASAVAVFRGVSGTVMKSFKDGASLRRTDTGWAVVLRKNFGKKSTRSRQ
ncbi:MAG: hypothetical protein JWO38_2065 [Gemmataceae bacterium]|nr:hypothetical protein [Gemmataceae bacterium]